jgi:hypothetical protein
MASHADQGSVGAIFILSVAGTAGSARLITDASRVRLPDPLPTPRWIVSGCGLMTHTGSERLSGAPSSPGSSNGRAAVLQTADEGSIPSPGTIFVFVV